MDSNNTDTNVVNNETSEKFDMDLSDFIKTYVDNGEIVVSYENEDAGKSNEYSFMISRYGKYLTTIKQQNSTMKYKPAEDGVYKIEVSSDKYIGTVCVSFFRKNTDEMYNNFLNADIETDHEPTKFFPYKYPFNNFCVIVNANISDLKFAKQHDLKILNAEIEGTEVKIVTSSEFTDVTSGRLILSGSLNIGDRFVYGQEDIEKQDKIESYIDKVGGYSCILWQNGKLTCATDYFGLDSLYYCQDGDKFFISNRYHMLLKILKEVGVKLNISEEYARNSLFVLNNFLNDYPFNYECFIENIKVLPIGNKFEITSAGVAIKDTEITKIFNAPIISDEEYKELLFKAKEEILNNMRVVLDSKHFERLSMDLTGGMDSRVAFAAAASVEGANERIDIFSGFANNNPEFLIAASLSDAFGFNYEFKRTGFSKNLIGNQNSSFQKQLECTESITMHQLLDPVLLPISNKPLPHSLNLNGQAIEACTRAYRVRLLNPDRLLPSFDSPDLILKKISSESICKYILRANILGNGYDEYVKSQFQVLDDLPGKSDFEKLEYNYLFFRNRFHFSMTKLGGYSTNRYSPGMSKSAFKAFHLTYGKYGAYQFIYDLMHVLNPIVASYQYGDPKYDEMRKVAYRKSVVLKPSDYAFIPYKTDLSRFNKQREEYIKSIEKVKEFEKIQYKLYNSKNNNIKDRSIYLRDCTIEDLKLILDNASDEFKETTGKELFYYLTVHLGSVSPELFNQKVKTLYIKLHDIASQIKEVKNEI